MPYRPDYLRLNKFYRYIVRVFSFGDTVKAMTDSRKNPKVPMSTIFRGMFLCVLLRWGSKRSITKESKRHQVSKLLGSDVDCCDNTVGHGLSRCYATQTFHEHIGIETLEEELTRASRQLKRNKAFRDTIGGLHIVALDGTETFRSTSIHCNECLVYRVKTKDGTQTHYVHRVVVAQKVGTQLKPVLAGEKILPKYTQEKDDKTPGHEGELTAAKRLVDKVIKLYGPRFVDVFTTDALYMNQPFVMHLAEFGKDLIARVKDERTVLYQEILALSQLGQPICGEDKDGTLRYQIYEIDNLHQSLGWSIPLRGFLVIERTRNVHNKKITWTETSFLCATTLPKWKANANVVRKIVHAKWGIENNGFNDFKNNWLRKALRCSELPLRPTTGASLVLRRAIAPRMTHNYHHHPNATFAALLILFLAYNLFYAYVFLSMKTYRLYSLTIKEVVLEFNMSFWNQRYWPCVDAFG